MGIPTALDLMIVNTPVNPAAPKCHLQLNGAVVRAAAPPPSTVVLAGWLQVT